MVICASNIKPIIGAFKYVNTCFIQSKFKIKVRNMWEKPELLAGIEPATSPINRSDYPELQQLVKAGKNNGYLQCK